jgi:PAS domain S-box-containing protein
VPIARRWLVLGVTEGRRARATLRGMSTSQRPVPQAPDDNAHPAAAGPAIPGALAGPDYQALFEAAPTPLLVLRPPEFRIVAANDAYLRATMTRREQLVGALLFEMFPDDPQDPGATGVSQLRASLQRVVATRQEDVMPLQRYPIQRPAALGGGYEERWWSPVNSPVLGPQGAVAHIIHRVEDFTGLMQQRDAAEWAGLPPLQRSLMERLRAATLAVSQAQAALRASEARLAQIFERAPVGLSEIAPDGRVLRVNAELARLLGRHIDDVCGLNILDITHPSDQRLTAAAVARVLGPVGFASLDKRYLRPDGSVVHTQSSVTRLEPGEDGQPRLLVVTVDLGERRTAEAALRESERRFRTIADLVPDLLWSNDADGHVDWLNQRWTEYTGLAPTESYGNGWMAAVHPDDLPETRGRWRRALYRREPITHQHRLRGRDGQYRWFLLRTQLLDAGEGGPVRWFGSATDVHEQRSAREVLERRVQQRTRELRAVLNSAASAIVATDLQGRITTLNPAAEALLRLPAPQAVGRPVLDFLERRELRRRFHRLPQEVQQLLWPPSRPQPRPAQRAGVQGKEWHCARADGTRFPALINVSVLHDEQGHATGFLGVVTDLSERKRLEEALRQRTAQAEAANRAKSTFLAHMSHEFRTPLNAVIGLSHLLSRMELPERALGFVHHIEQGGEQLLALINDVLDLSRIEAGEMRLEQVPFELQSLLEAACALVRPQAQAKGLALRLDAAPALPAWLLGDPLRLKQVLLNLLGNAVKFTPEGSVTLRVRELGREAGRARLSLEVVDTGIGIDAEKQARIFEPFTQADSSITRRFGGTGLGLSIVRRLVEMMDGELRLDSAPGRGSTFGVTLALEVGGEGTAGS